MSFSSPRRGATTMRVEFRLEGEIGRTHVIGSYTLSRLYGNYAGLANSDEAGRMDPSISRSFDLPTYYFDSSGRQRNVEGRLATDRPHVFKVFGWREFQNRFGSSNIGLTQVAMSGGLDSTTVGYLTAPTFPFGRGDLGRMPVFTQTDHKSHAHLPVVGTHESEIRSYCHECIESGGRSVAGHPDQPQWQHNCPTTAAQSVFCGI